MTTDKHEELVKRAGNYFNDADRYDLYAQRIITDLLAENARLKAEVVPLTGRANGGGEIDVIQAIKDAAEFVKHPANYPDKVFAVVVLTHLEQALTLLTPPKEK